MAKSQRGSSPLLVLLAGLGGAGLLAAGFAAGRLTAPAAGAPGGGRPEARQPATPAELEGLPAGNVVLVDPLGRRVFTLATRTGPIGDQPLELRAFRVGEEGRFEPAGRFRLDPRAGVLTDASNRRYPVATDFSGGAIRVLRGGTLVVNTRPSGARIFVDGRDAGAAPLKLTLPAGLHRVRAQGRSWLREGDWEVVPGSTVTINLAP